MVDGSSKPAFEYHIADDRCHFSMLQSDGSFISFDRWSDFETEASFGTLAVIEGFIQSGLAVRSEDSSSVVVPLQTIADLDESIAAALGLPSDVPYVLQIDARGRLGTLRLQMRWVDESGLRVRDARTNGCMLERANRSYRLASPFFEVIRRIEAFNARGDAPPADQARDWAEIQEAIGIAAEHIKPGQFLERMRVARANRFSLDFIPGGDGGFQIAPVPLLASRSPQRSPEGAVDAEDDVFAHREPARMLSSSEQERFQRAFHARREVQNQYLGGDDVYVLFSPEVKRSLEVVRRMQDRPPAERLAFARNPYSFLKDGDTDAEAPFAESRSFSDRVTGLGILGRVTLPWQILGSQGWLPPDVVEVGIGDASFDIPPTSLDAAIVDVELAIAQGRSSIVVGNQTIPATQQAREAFLAARSDLDERANLAAANTHERGTASAAKDRVGLQVTRNLEEAEYAAQHAERSRVALELPPIETTLKEHQIEAVRWLQQRWLNGKRGALLADDMGLGKSLSALAFMVWLRAAMQAGTINSRPMLIVAPVSLLQNWQSEHARHIGTSPNAFVDVVRAYGSDLPRRGAGRDLDTGAAMLDLDRLIIDRFGLPTCVLTTYETLRDYQQSFASVRFALVVLDEAQRVKNPASLAWHAVSALHSDFWIALTGTPVENRLADLWAIADILEPSFLGSLRTFSNKYEAAFDPEALRELKTIIEQSPDGAPFMLRRLKEHVLDGIPPKHEHLHPLPMPPVQASAYAEIVASAHDKIAPKQMLAVVQQLREASLHPLKPTDCSPASYVSSSARFQSLFAILDQVHTADEKALIFVDRNIVEAYLARLIRQQYRLERLPSIINGAVPSTKRQTLVDEFQNRAGFDVMILSPRAGGVGLTLTAANHVVHLSRWWNPAVEDQSTDRVYRIGQRKPVHVHYLQATLPDQPGQSFDERLHLLLEKKRSLSRDLLWPFESATQDSEVLLGRKPA